MYCANWKKTDSKGYIPHDWIDMTYWKVKTIGKKISCCQGWGRVDCKGWQQGRHGGAESALYFYCGSGYTTMHLSKPIELYKKKMPNLLYLNLKINKIKSRRNRIYSWGAHRTERL